MTIFFPDVSEYTPNVDVTPYPVVIARATLSASLADTSYATYKQRSAGKVFAAYHWLNHGNTAVQAKWCFDHVGPDVPLMIDAEDEPGNTGYAGPLTIADITGFAADYRALGGIVHLVYLPHWYWMNQMGAVQQLDQLATSRLQLVSSDYPSGGYTETGVGWTPYYLDAPFPVQWQYTSTPIDMNAFRGTAAEFAAMIGGTMTNPLTDAQARQLANADQWWYDTVTEQDPVTNIYAAPDGRPLPLPNLPLQRATRIEQKLDALAAKVAALSAPAPVDVAALVAALQAAGFLTKQELDAKLAAAQGA